MPDRVDQVLERQREERQERIRWDARLRNAAVIYKQFPFVTQSQITFRDTWTPDQAIEVLDRIRTLESSLETAMAIINRQADE
jgi:hypothetical protein